MDNFLLGFCVIGQISLFGMDRNQYQNCRATKQCMTQHVKLSKAKYCFPKCAKPCHVSKTPILPAQCFWGPPNLAWSGLVWNALHVRDAFKFEAALSVCCPTEHLQARCLALPGNCQVSTRAAVLATPVT
eukprot:evm.model.scf_2792.2 EVM.evm.TU.scf_2792.2   scf_2792:12825-13214(+)